jgi:hypothetical protein
MQDADQSISRSEDQPISGSADQPISGSEDQRISGKRSSGGSVGRRRRSTSPAANPALSWANQALR